MAFSDLVNSMDTACLDAFGTAVTFTPQNGSGAQQITGIIQNPAMAEDYVPGSVQGTAVVRLFVRFANLAPPPRRLTDEGSSWPLRVSAFRLEEHYSTSRRDRCSRR